MDISGRHTRQCGLQHVRQAGHFRDTRYGHGRTVPAFEMAGGGPAHRPTCGKRLVPDGRGTAAVSGVEAGKTCTGAETRAAGCCPRAARPAAPLCRGRRRIPGGRQGVPHRGDQRGRRPPGGRGFSAAHAEGKHGSLCSAAPGGHAQRAAFAARSGGRAGCVHRRPAGPFAAFQRGPLSGPEGSIQPLRAGLRKRCVFFVLRRGRARCIGSAAHKGAACRCAAAGRSGRYRLPQRAMARMLEKAAVRGRGYSAV